MAKCWSATSLVALALLGCLVWTQTEALENQQMVKGVQNRQETYHVVEPQPQSTQQQQESQQHWQSGKTHTYSVQLFVQEDQGEGAKPVEKLVSKELSSSSVPSSSVSSASASSVSLGEVAKDGVKGEQHGQRLDQLRRQQQGQQRGQQQGQQWVQQQGQLWVQQQAPSNNPGTVKAVSDQSSHTAKVPQSQNSKAQQTSPPYNPPAVKQPPIQSCEVARSVRVPCGPPDISADGCGAIDCCFDGQQCFFGKAVTVQCTKDAQFIVVVAKDATLPNIDLDSISLLGGGQGCAHTDSNSEFVIYQFPVTSCGSIVMEEPGVIIYENRMSSAYEVGLGPLGAITRDSHFDFLFQCRYIGTSAEALVAEVLPIAHPPLPVAAQGPIRVHMRLANGLCHTKGCNEVEAAYHSYYMESEYPVTKQLRHSVYVDVELLDKTDPNLVLTLGRCWTTTSPNPHSLPQWDILIDGCPYHDDRYLSSLVPVSGVEFPSHHRRFIFKMFTFVDPNSMTPLKEMVYIHCSTSVCAAAPGRSCNPSCFGSSKDYRTRRNVEAMEQSRGESKVVVSAGPLAMTRPEQETE